MKCSKCGSDNVSIQVVNESQLVTKHHGILWWIFVSWWWIPIKWLVHSSITVTLNTYIHLYKNELVEMANLINNV